MEQGSFLCIQLWLDFCTTIENNFRIFFPKAEIDIFNLCFKGVRGLFGTPKALSSL